MSYDFRLFKRREGEDPRVTARRDSEGLAAGPADPHKEALKRSVADALIAHNPKLEVFQIRHDQIAAFEKISIEEARRKYRYLELNGPKEDGNGIQITLFDDEASVTVPYWHEGETAAAPFREIWRYLEIISREAGYLIYDPQLDRVIDVASNPNDSQSRYTGVVDRINVSRPSAESERKSWWKIW